MMISVVCKLINQMINCFDLINKKFKIINETEKIMNDLRCVMNDVYVKIEQYTNDV